MTSPTWTASSSSTSELKAYFRTADFHGALYVSLIQIAELLDGQHALAAGLHNAALRTERDQERHRVGAGCGVTEIAANRGTALNLSTADDRCRIGEIEENGNRRYLVENFRRTSGAAPKRILL